MKIKLVRDMTKTKKSHTCYYCKDKIPSGSYCFGKGGNYAKICLNCKKEISFPKRINFLKRNIKEIQDDMKMLAKNLNKYERVNILAKLQDE